MALMVWDDGFLVCSYLIFSQFGGGKDTRRETNVSSDEASVCSFIQTEKAEIMLVAISVCNAS